MNVTPLGNVSPAASISVGVGEPIAVTVKLPDEPTVKTALLLLVKTGAWLTVRVKLCVAVPEEFVAVMVMG